MNVLQVRVYEDRQLKHSDEFAGAVELGRQREGEPGPFARAREGGRWRLVIARHEENDLARRHAFIEPLPGGRVRLTNSSASQPIRFLDRPPLDMGASCELPLPVVLTLGPKVVRLQEPASEEGGRAPLHSLPEATLPPRCFAASAPFPDLAGTAGRIDSKEVIRWLHSALDVLQAAADSADFFGRAAQAMVDMVRLDAGRVLLVQGGAWQVRALQMAVGANSAVLRRPSQRVLQKVLQEKRTCWEGPAAYGSAAGEASLAGVEAVVAAPLLDRHGKVLGALYGERVARAGVEPLTEVEAMLVELIVRGVAAGLARLEQEQAAAAERVRFEQFFLPELARHLAQNPDRLQGREAEVTVLFCDIRGFSRISEQLGVARTAVWRGDVLDVLSDCILTEGGVLVEYIGDGVVAMWGAPEAQPDHAHRACQSALRMLSGLPALDARWRATIGEELRLGIGLNTGPAQVGNIGSRYKFKYGPLGGTVNVASRVEGVTKQLRCAALLTAATQAQLGQGVPTRRLGRVRVVGIDAPVELYELAAPGRPGWPEARSAYEEALERFEGGDFVEAARILGSRQLEGKEDGPALRLLHRAVTALVEGPPAAHPVWVLRGK